MEISNLDISSDKRWDRLASAILQKAVSDFKKYAKINTNAIKRKKKYTIFTSAAELRQIVAFIMSEWCAYLTNYNCPQKDCVMKLMELVDKSQWEYILKDYVSI